MGAFFNSRLRIFLLVADGFLLAQSASLLLTQDALAKSEQTIRAFTVWQTTGQPPAGTAGVFNDTVTGLLYVETEKGPVAAGQVSCKAQLTVNADKTQKGAADCTITTKDAAQVFSKLTCSGVFMVGCSGEITLTGGSGRFSGVTGGGKAIIRSEFADLQQQGNADPAMLRTGIIYFPALRYQLP